ncbi:hypothetical protein Ccrd_020151 [Cynara cardunculus var. scolymus]|uniref:Uncharacterized protein n=1 Tax=Cynara cardunculus var. scolymus TaxID=59895 RepID=A0A118K0L7_CYNCS|nr:hypothetical protein Ccrd_020151 [Cynara cardunculus var. scolymus]
MQIDLKPVNGWKVCSNRFEVDSAVVHQRPANDGRCGENAKLKIQTKRVVKREKQKVVVESEIQISSVSVVEHSTTPSISSCKSIFKGSACFIGLIPKSHVGGAMPAYDRFTFEFDIVLSTTLSIASMIPGLNQIPGDYRFIFTNHSNVLRHLLLGLEELVQNLVLHLGSIQYVDARAGRVVDMKKLSYLHETGNFSLHLGSLQYVDARVGGLDDMKNLSYLHEAGVLQNLSTKFQLNEIHSKKSLMLVASMSYQTLARKQRWQQLPPNNNNLDEVPALTAKEKVSGFIAITNSQIEGFRPQIYLSTFRDSEDT